LSRSESGHRHGGRLLEGHAGRLAQDDSIVPKADVLSQSAQLRQAAEHLITGSEAGYAGANRLDCPCHVSAQLSAIGLGPREPGLEPREVGHAPHEVPVERV
jgi:hypothetical protein